MSKGFIQVWDLIREKKSEEEEKARIEDTLVAEEEAERKEVARTVSTKPKTPRETLGILWSNLDANILGQSKMKEVVLAGLVSRQDVLVISPWGEGKTTIIDVLGKSIVGERIYKSYMLTPDTRSIDFLGELVAVEENRGDKTLFRLESTVYDGVAGYRIVLFDEVFSVKAVALQLVLDLLSHRVVKDVSGKIYPARTWVVYGLSNEVPDVEVDRSAGKLFDRFVARLYLPKTPADKIADIVRFVYKRKTDARIESIVTRVSEQDIEAVHRDFDRFFKSKLAKYTTIIDVVAKLTSISPRRAVFLAKFLGALDYVRGGRMGYISLVKYGAELSADSPEDVGRILGKLSEMYKADKYLEIESELERAEQELEQRNFGTANTILRELYNRVSEEIKNAGDEFQREQLREYLERIKALEKEVARVLRSVPTPA